MCLSLPSLPPHHFSMRSSERTYVDLIFRATNKYARWDPEIVVRVGDYGRITRGRRGIFFWRNNGTFMREDNIYDDGKAAEHEIPDSVEYGRESKEETLDWITSQNATRVDSSFSAGGTHPALAQCTMKGAYKFSSGRGAILAMKNAMITIIDPPGALKRLLEDPSMRGVIVVSEVHSCSAYARMLTVEEGGTIALGLQVEPPLPGVASAGATASWVWNVASENLKSQHRSGGRNQNANFRLTHITDPDLLFVLKFAEGTSARIILHSVVAESALRNVGRLEPIFFFREEVDKPNFIMLNRSQGTD
ncbi:hypothetical protein B0H19DRAFT_1367675 [Mycena capillaripes]|nr:hypothetical protein B0H19DRAFT_1367675 [Mycena capillaripes]